MIKSVAILGMGAVGSYVLYGLSKKLDVDLCVIGEGERKERYEKEGWIINGKQYNPVIKTPMAAKNVDLLIVSVKYNSLDTVLPYIKEIVGENTIVMSLMNGVDSEEKIGTVVDSKHIVHSLIKIASERRGNEIRFDPDITIGIIFGEANKEKTQRVYNIKALFDEVDLHSTISEDILSSIWEKYRLNVSYNLPQAIIGCGVGAYADSEHVSFLRNRLKAEVEAVANAKGIQIEVQNYSTKNLGAKRARYSTLQDLDAKRHTEVDMFAGAMVKMGKELGVPTPYSEFVYHVIKALEEKNDGLFDYE